MNSLDRKEKIKGVLSILSETLSETESRFVIQDGNFIFFGCDDYISVGDINKIPRFSYPISRLLQ